MGTQFLTWTNPALSAYINSPHISTHFQKLLLTKYFCLVGSEDITWKLHISLFIPPHNSICLPDSGSSPSKCKEFSIQALGLWEEARGFKKETRHKQQSNNQIRDAGFSSSTPFYYLKTLSRIFHRWNTCSKRRTHTLKVTQMLFLEK